MPNQRKNFFRFLKYVKPYTHFVVLAAVGGVVKFTLPLLIPDLTRTLLDHVFNNTQISIQEKLNLLFFNIGIVAALFLVVWVPFTYIRSYYAGKAGHRSVFDLRCDLYDHILRLSASFFNVNRSGGIVSRLISDVALAQNLVGSALTNIWIDSSAIFVILFFLFRIDALTAWVALAMFPCYLFFFRKIGIKLKATSLDVQQKIEHMSGDLQEKIAGHIIVRAFNREKHEGGRLYCSSENLFNTTMRSISLQSINMSVSGIFTHLPHLMVLLFGGYRVIHGQLTMGGLVAISMYLAPLYLPLQRFSELNVIFAQAMAALDRIFELMDLKPEITDSAEGLTLPEIKGDVEFRDVYFSYTNHQYVLKNLNFKATAGTRVALVGASGSGKSTIAGLIPRFYDINSGCITIDGHCVKDIKLKSLRNHIGMVLQEPVLFSGTIRENILYGRPEATLDEVAEACKMANAFEFITELPGGLDTEIGERGTLLSGGQKQRLTIARAFLKNPRILILDEATSSLDSEAEALIQEALARLMMGRTTLIIAHRLSTIMHVDKIIVIAKGSIVEEGNHWELLKNKSHYYRFYKKQHSLAS